MTWRSLLVKVAWRCLETGVRIQRGLLLPSCQYRHTKTDTNRPNTHSLGRKCPSL